MKNTQWHITLSLLFLFSSFSFAQKNFEGVITIENTNPNSLNATFTIKDDKAMMDTKTDEGKLILITDESSGKKLTICERNGKVTAVKKESRKDKYNKDLKKRYENRSPNNGANKVIVTRETKKINGYKCFKITAKNKQHEGEAWVTKQLDLRLENFFPSMRVNQRTMPQIAKTLQNGVNGFVMEMTFKNIKTKKEDKMIVTMEKKKIEDNAFHVSLHNAEVYDGAEVRDMIKGAKGDPAKMKKARQLLAQLRIQ